MMNAIGLDVGARAVRGSHGRLPGDPRDEPVLICTDPAYGREGFAATEVKDLLLCLAGLAGWHGMPAPRGMCPCLSWVAERISGRSAVPIPTRTR
ncbi:hypothetical protein [Salinispora vitiensis]|uniref:hypothetical protein n=1 Tax=Salinispora vitiensis TaxID=999544 RepID=UPI0003AA53DA|nr:hypothetical protein [Salinispora vitiensis]